MKEKDLLKMAKQELTVEVLRTYKGFENTPEEEAVEIIRTLTMLTEILVDDEVLAMLKTEPEGN
jgi:hypothetical protein